MSFRKAFYAGVDPTNMLGAFENLGSAMDTIKMKGLDGAKALGTIVAMFDQAGWTVLHQVTPCVKCYKKG